MCKRFLLLLLLLGFCVSPVVNAATIVWVGEADDNNNDGVADDLGWIQWLEDQGFDVVSRPTEWATLDDEDLAICNAADLVIVSRNTDSGDYDDGDEETRWNTITAPMMLLSPYLSRSNRWDWFNHTGLSRLSTSPTVTAVLPGHNVFLGVPLGAGDQVNPYDASVPSTGIYAPSGDVGPGTLIARALTGEPLIVEWAAGTEFPESDFGAVAVNRRMLFCAGSSETGGIPQGAFNLSPVGEQMFINAVRDMSGLDLYAASMPSPRGVDVLRDVVLSWLPGPTMMTHDLYLGTDPDVVAAATRQDPQGALIEQAYADTMYSVGTLAYGTTYYWRVDEVQGGTFHTGGLWSFTVEPWAYPLPESAITISASVPNAVTSPDPNVLIDGSGIDADGNHSTAVDDMWLGSGAAPVSVTLTLDQIYKLNEITIWNLNNTDGAALGFGFNDTVVDYSVDGQTWITAVEAQLAPGTGFEPVAGETLPLGDIDAQYVRITANNNQMGVADLYGLSEIALTYVPVRAREPQPASGTQNVDPSVVLGWRTGRQAATHQVHVGLDPNAVAAGDALVDAVAGNSYDASALNLLLGEKYYWMITEVNEAETPSAWDSPVWDFNTADILVVDDMESYNDNEGSRIFDVWVDGYGVNDNGSLVGNNVEPFAEEDAVHGGGQSMPFRYGEDGATTSEATLTPDAPMNWTRSGVQTLVIWFRGSLGNATGQLYLKVNGGAPVNYTGSMGSLAAPVWKQWNIDVASLGNAAQNVTSVTLGVSATGKGQLYFDDIALYREAGPQTGGAVDPGTANLMALYSMEDNANDESGHGYNGTAETGSSFGTGPSGYGRAIVLDDGASGHVTLPIGPLVQTLSSATFATWVNWTGSGSTWCRIFDFGTGQAVNMFLTPNAGGGSLRFAITAGGAGGESQLNAGYTLPGGWQHVAVTIDEATSHVALYVNGSVVADGATGVLPSDLGNTTQNYLGRSQYPDPYLPGSLDDFRIYNRALSAEEIRYLVGDR